MELDEIKKIWDEMDSLKEKLQISDNRIKEMLKKTGESALAKLLKIGKISIISIIPLGLFMCLLSFNFFKADGYYFICPLLFLLICLLAFPFEIYCFRILKSIDFSNMTVVEVTERILKYQKIVKRAEMYGIIGAVIYLCFWYYLSYKLSFGSEVIWGLIIFMIIMCFVVVFLTRYLYKQLYYNNIKKISDSLKELREFED